MYEHYYSSVTAKGLNSFKDTIDIIMPTTLQIDDDLAEEYRNAVQEKYGKTRGRIGKETKAAIKERIKLLKGE